MRYAQPITPRSATIKTTWTPTADGYVLQFDDHGIVYQAISRPATFVAMLNLLDVVMRQIDNDAPWSDVAEVQTLI